MPTCRKWNFQDIIYFNYLVITPKFMESELEMINNYPQYIHKQTFKKKKILK